MIMLMLLLCGVALVNSSPLADLLASTDSCGYESCTQADQGSMLNVHIVPHTHDDVGWLKTVDQYYYGSRNDIQKAGVQYILDSVIKELWDNPKRRFIYVETFFFWKWWVKQTESVRRKVRALVRQGRLQLAGGAWDMNDEAAAHYHSTIDQFTWGLSKLNQTFGPCGMPRVGWQIDPFGHSREFASLLAGMGYDGLFLGRIDYQDKEARKRQKTMEMLWRGDDDLGKASDLFTGVLFNTYSPPPGFCFDILCQDEPIIDDPDSPMYNVEKRVEAFLKIAQNMQVTYRSNNILVTMGEDFNYQDANMWFTNLDKLIDYINNQKKHYRSNNVILTMGGDFTYQDAGMYFKNLDKLIEYTNLKAAKDDLNIKLFYSTPDCYLKAVKDANPTLPTKQDDFFPYASDPTAYWTGYFTSRPTTKYFERQANNYLQMVKQLQVLAALEDHNSFILNELKSAVGIMQHHDAITGTEKEHVTHDYERILNDAIDDALIIARQAFNKYMQGDASSPPVLNCNRCRLNESSCETSETSVQFVLTVYNHLAWQVNDSIRIPVTEGNYVVYAPNGEQIQTQIVDIPSYVLNIPTRISQATHEIIFIAHLHPLSYKSYYVKKIHKITKRNTENEQKDDLVKNMNDKKRNFYNTEMNEYWKNIRELPNIEIKNMEDGKVLTNLHTVRTGKLSDARIPEEPVFVKNYDRKDGTNVDWNVLRDKGSYNSDVDQLEGIIEETRRPVDEARKAITNSHSAMSAFSNLNEDEMRMLSDDPLVVERFPEDVFLENQHLKLRVNSTTGEIILATLRDGSDMKLNFKYSYYPGCYGDNYSYANRSSGAYIFRPNATKAIDVSSTYSKGPMGPVVREIRLATNDNINSAIRIYDGLNFIENDWVVGPINIDDGVGKEYIVKYVTDIINNGEFYTDSNGRQMLKRKLSERPQWNVTLAEPIAGNYYPVTNKISILDDKVKIAVLTDRSEGGSSLLEGQIELMLHRRLLHDDAFGVGEALNETANGKGLVVRGTHRLFLSKADNKKDHIEEKKKVLEYHLQPQIFISKADDLSLEDWLKLKNCHSWANALPDGLHLLTLEPWRENTLLLRLENYLELSDREISTVEIDLNGIFKGIRLKSFKETTLAANRWIDDVQKWSWNTENEFDSNFNKAYGTENDEKAREVDIEEDDGYKIKIKAKQIRTFIVEYEMK